MRGTQNIKKRRVPFCDIVNVPKNKTQGSFLWHTMKSGVSESIEYYIVKGIVPISFVMDFPNALVTVLNKHAWVGGSFVLTNYFDSIC
jgi:hypothetical protein